MCVCAQLIFLCCLFPICVAIAIFALSFHSHSFFNMTDLVDVSTLLENHQCAWGGTLALVTMQVATCCDAEHPNAWPSYTECDMEVKANTEQPDEPDENTSPNDFLDRAWLAKRSCDDDHHFGGDGYRSGDSGATSDGATSSGGTSGGGAGGDSSDTNNSNSNDDDVDTGDEGEDWFRDALEEATCYSFVMAADDFDGGGSGGDMLFDKTWCSPCVPATFNTHTHNEISDVTSEDEEMIEEVSDLSMLNIDLSWLDNGDDEFERKRLENVVGKQVEILTDMNKWRGAVVTSEVCDGRYMVIYLDGDVEQLRLGSRIWRRVS